MQFQNMGRNLKQKLARSDFVVFVIAFLGFAFLLQNFLWAIPMAIMLYIYSRLHYKIFSDYKDR